VFGNDARPGILCEVDEGDRWLREHPKVEITLPDQPRGDWRVEEGYGWIAKIWFLTWREAVAAKTAIEAEGWEAKFWGRKIRIHVNDGFDAQRLADVVLDRWPDVRQIQLRCD
jgi:hypothetical protein